MRMVLGVLALQSGQLVLRADGAGLDPNRDRRRGLGLGERLLVQQERVVRRQSGVVLDQERRSRSV